MKRISLVLAALMFVMGCGEPPATPAPAATTEPPASPAAQAVTVEQDAAAFYVAFSQGDTEKMAPFYADEVTLLGGSEFLKPEYGLNAEEGRGKSLVLTRKKLMSTYESFIAKVGTDQWQGIWAKLPVDGLSYHEPTEYRPQMDAALPGDVLVLVPFGVGDDVGAFLFRQQAGGHWVIVMELTDY